MKRWFCLILSAILLLGLCSGAVLAAEREDIVILYENDVHCAVEGYAALAAMKQELSQTHDHVGVVSVGDFVQGSSLGAVSQGSYIVELMNMVGYDAIALGNHECDYRIDRLMELVSRMETKPVWRVAGIPCAACLSPGAGRTRISRCSIGTWPG